LQHPEDTSGATAIAPVASERRAWYRSKARQVLEMLPAPSRTLVRELDSLPKDADVGPATLVVFVCFLYAEQLHADAIAEHLHTVRVFRSSLQPREILHRLVQPVCEAFRACRLPFHRWWDAEEAYLAFHHFYLGQRIADVGANEVHKELATLWRMERDDVIQSYIDDAMVPISDIPLGFLENPGTDALGRVVQRLVDSDSFRSLTEKVSELHRPELFERPALLRVAELLHTLDFLRTLIPSILQEPQAGRAVERLAAERRRVAVPLQGLSAFEMALLVPGDPEDLYLDRCLALHRDFATVDRLGINALPEVFEGQIRLPTRLQTYVFSQGGRLLHRSAGPIAHLFAVLESPRVQVRGLSVGEIGRSDSMLEVELLMRDAGPGVMAMPFRYTLSYLPDVYDLLLWVQTGRARLDLARLSPDGSLELVLSARIGLPEEVRSELREIVLDTLRSQYGDDAEALKQALLSDGIRFDADSGVLACEQAKSEQLLDEMIRGPEGQREGIEPRYWEAYQKARTAWLLFHEKRALAQRATAPVKVEPGTAPGPAEDWDEKSLELEDRLIQARQRLRARTGSGERLPEEKMADLARALGSDDRCLVHLTYSGEHPVAFWCRPDGEGFESGHLDLSEHDIDTTARQARRWIEDSDPSRRLRDLPALLDALRPELFDRIASELSDRGVRHLVLSPVWPFEALPLHCIPMSEAGNEPKRLLDLFDSITYIPSGRILRELTRAGSIELETVAAISYSPPERPIHNVEREVGLVRELFRPASVVSGSRATPESLLKRGNQASILHLACHSAWIVDHPLTSGLWLYGEPPTAGYLSVARILREGSFRDTGLVVLSSCESGLSFTKRRTVQNYTGIDGAFLARGARASLSTLWELHDLAAFLFMTAFYTALDEGLTVDHAYRRAVDFLRYREYREPVPKFLKSLQRLHPEWRQGVTELEEDFGALSEPFFWGAFKCSGWTWGSRS